MFSTPSLLDPRFIVIDCIFPTVQTPVYRPPLVYLQVRFEAFLLAERLAVAFRIWAHGWVRGSHMSLELRPGGEKLQGGWPKAGRMRASVPLLVMGFLVSP